MNWMEDEKRFYTAFSRPGRVPPLIPPSDFEALDKFIEFTSTASLEGIAKKLDEIKEKRLPNKAPPRWDEDFAWNVRRVNAEDLQVFRTNEAKLGLMLGFLTAGAVIGTGITAAVTGGAAIPAMVGFGWLGSQVSLGAYGIVDSLAAEDQSVFEMEKRRQAAQKAIALAELDRKKDEAAHGFLSTFLTLHIDCFSPEEIDQMQATGTCPFEMDYPLVPVFSPHDVERRHPYEREKIIEHMDRIERRLELLRKFDSPEAHNLVREMEETVDPFRGPYFTSDQLVFDLEHARKRLAILRRIHTRMHSELGRNLDTVQEKALEQIFTFYQYTYGEKTDLHLVEIFTRCKKAHMSPEDKDAVAEEFARIRK